MTKPGCSEPVFVIEGGAIDHDGHAILGPLDVAIPGHAVTVVLGPSASGKSTLLAALASRVPEGLRVRGSWRRSSSADPAWIEQRPRTRALDDPTSDGGASWRAAFASGARTLLLDEPTRGLDDRGRDELATMLRALARVGAAVVITHDQRFARSVADRVIFLVNGEVDAETDASEFFARPPTDLARRFVDHGNCPVPARERPTLPSHFHWLLPGQLAGMGVPGLLRPLDDDLAAIADAGVTMVVSLTEAAFPPPALRELGIASHHLPIPDMGVPSISAASRACRLIEREVERGGRVAVHCRAGLGRTGTMLACFLAWTGTPADDAITRARSVQPRWIQNRAQESFVRSFAGAVSPPGGAA